MKNVERFEIYAAYIFARMYEDFPMARVMNAQEIVKAVRLEPGRPDDSTWENTFVVNTYRWLVDTGYIIERDGAPQNRLVLAPKAFEALKTPMPLARPETEGEDEGKSVGEKLVEITSDIGTDVVKEGKKQTIQELVGWIIAAISAYAKIHFAT